MRSLHAGRAQQEALADEAGSWTTEGQGQMDGVPLKKSIGSQHASRRRGSSPGRFGLAANSASGAQDQPRGELSILPRSHAEVIGCSHRCPGAHDMPWAMTSAASMEAFQVHRGCLRAWKAMWHPKHSAVNVRSSLMRSSIVQGRSRG